MRVELFFVVFAVLVECGVSGEVAVVSPLDGNVSVAVYCKEGYRGGRWILYLYNGCCEQYMSALRYGSNVGGYGSVSSMPSDGAHKMDELLFDAFAFTEVLAVDNNDDWVTIEKVDSSVFVSSEAFDVNYASGIRITRGDNNQSKSFASGTFAYAEGTTSNITGDGYGPFYHDVFDGSGFATSTANRDTFGWMWVSGESDLRKGTVYGAYGSSTSYSWAWYGRSASSCLATPTAAPTAAPTPLVCRAGYYHYYSGGDNNNGSVCALCDAGFYGSTEGLVNSTCTGVCDVGRYGSADSVRTDRNCTGVCGAGHFSGALQGSTGCTACALNYSSLAGSSDPSNCSPCHDANCTAFCSDGVQNGDEFAVDCGGACESGCAAGEACAVDTDCDWGSCKSSVCEGCGDGVKNGDESDIDCGGPYCDTCSAASSCLDDADCLSSVCLTSINICNTPSPTLWPSAAPSAWPSAQPSAAPTAQPSTLPTAAPSTVQARCADGLQNGNETDIDCGGVDCNRTCADHAHCLVDSDCASGWCDASNGAPLNRTCASCADEVQNGNETDIDCGGGGHCSNTTCADLGNCRVDSDCSSRWCDATSLTCASCTDGRQNGNETDIDCGGDCGATCADLARCLVDADCASGWCDASNASVPFTCASCADGIANGNETDIDCGGNTCALTLNITCGALKTCEVGTDCASGTCLTFTSPPVCHAPDHCSSGTLDGDESDVDCGGSCLGCASGGACGLDSDCDVGACESSLCTTLAPTAVPTVIPSVTPTAVPTAFPSAVPSSAPTALPSSAPSTPPTDSPSATPSARPTASPSAAPSTEPTASPSIAPSRAPTSAPSAAPTELLFSVNSYADSSSGDCSVGNGGTCNLRAALTACKDLTCTLQVPSGAVHYLANGLKDITVTGDLTVESSEIGGTVTIDGDGNGGRLLIVSGSVTVGDSFVFQNFYDSDNGGVFNVLSSGVLTLGDYCGFLSNDADHGGAIYVNSGSTGVSVGINCTFNDNRATTSIGEGGAIATSSPVHIGNGCSFSNNWANDDGGAIAVYSGGGVLTVGVGCTFTANDADDDGDDIFGTGDIVCCSGECPSWNAYMYSSSTTTECTSADGACSVCPLCSAGKYSSKGLEAYGCEPCAAGTFGEDEGSTGCTACVSSQSSVEGSSSSASCSPCHDVNCTTFCSDGVENGDESAVDCGGDACVGCGAATACTTDTDCLSSVCLAIVNICNTPSPTVAPSSAPSAVPTFQPSATPTAAPSAAPTGSPTALLSRCADGVVNGNETDIDCGGGECNTTCADLSNCLVDADCSSGICAANATSFACASCIDGVQNGDETDIDCGGATCALALNFTCGALETCDAGTDCASGTCLTFASPPVCHAPDHCSTGALDGDESDIDCGGSCLGCASGGACDLDSDCDGIACESGVCTTPAPTTAPTAAPSVSTPYPTTVPTAAPSKFPTPLPSAPPTSAPSGQPSAAPSKMPSAMPSVSPTDLPYTINSFADSSDGDCSLNNALTCNLRAALAACYGLTCVISVPSSAVHYLNQGLGGITANGDITLQCADGGAATIDGSGNGGRFVYLSGDTSSFTVGESFVFRSFDESSTEDGGVFYIYYNTLIIGDGCSFLENSADDGGAIYVFGATSLVQVGANCIFSENIAATSHGFGGAIRAIQFSTVTVGAGCAFTSNMAYDSGGAMSAEDSATLIIGAGCSFTQNGGDEGGAIFATGSETRVEVGDNCVFSENEAIYYSGGAILAGYDALVIVGTRCSFTQNEADDGGGAVFALSGATVILGGGSTFLSNDAGSFGGGAIYVSDSATVVVGSGSTFDGNDANKGGAIMVEDGDSLMQVGANCIFNDNRATYYDGGAVYVYNSATANIGDGCAFSSNDADDDGGAICIDTDATVTLGDGCIFSANDADDDGDDIYLASSELFCCSGKCPDGFEVYDDNENDNEISTPTECASTGGACSACSINWLRTGPADALSSGGCTEDERLFHALMFALPFLLYCVVMVIGRMMVKQNVAEVFIVFHLGGFELAAACFLGVCYDQDKSVFAESAIYYVVLGCLWVLFFSSLANSDGADPSITGISILTGLFYVTIGSVIIGGNLNHVTTPTGSRSLIGPTIGPTPAPTPGVTSAATFAPTSAPTFAPTAALTPAPSASTLEPTSAPTPAHCTNGLFDGDESDNGCGGSCRGCELGFNCTQPSDCLSFECSGSECVVGGHAAPDSGSTLSLAAIIGCSVGISVALCSGVYFAVYRRRRAAQYEAAQEREEEIRRKVEAECAVKERARVADLTRGYEAKMDKKDVEMATLRRGKSEERKRKEQVQRDFQTQKQKNEAQEQKNERKAARVKAEHDAEIRKIRADLDNRFPSNRVDERAARARIISAEKTRIHDEMLLLRGHANGRTKLRFLKAAYHPQRKSASLNEWLYKELCPYVNSICETHFRLGCPQCTKAEEDKTWRK